MDRPDIYSDGERPERCANCNYVRTTVFRSVYGTERIEFLDDFEGLAQKYVALAISKED